MSSLEELTANTKVSGLDPSGPVEVVASKWHGDSAVTVTYRDVKGNVGERVLFRSDEDGLEIADRGRRWSFDGDGRLFRLAAEARRIHLAHLFDPMIAVTTSSIEPLPHQIEAVYGEMLPRLPLRYLLADDPGAGKTIMAGLYIKELIIRGDVERCLIVAPGGLVIQWQDELYEKFGLRFDIVTKDMLDASYSGDAFRERDQLIARIDQLSRRDDLVERLRHADWDLIVVDEAHRMAAHRYGDEVEETKRYKLGKVLGATARHLLLMTATPHAGKEDDFQLFMALLDADRFEGRLRDGVRTLDTSDLMRRMIKEKLLRFDGTPLFPERRAYTVTYPLSKPELRLYDEVTNYVRDEMNRADRLAREGEGRRGNTVGFALTILQRRLASSPEAIYQSLRRRRRRLETRVGEEKQKARRARLGLTPQAERLSGLLEEEDGGIDWDSLDDLDSSELEELEIGVADEASAAQTVAELEAEIQTLKTLEELARRVRKAGTDRKWSELAELLSNEREMFDADGNRRKLIIFSEHRDTMNYLVDRLCTFVGREEAVAYIHGGTAREERRKIQERFMQEKDCVILVATDAAGEGINLQRAHLVINYDLPWNPNRIEQRFGRVHRIGQDQVCHMWNLVAEETREAEVYIRLLDKIEEQRRAYKGQVFDVLGQALSGKELRELLIQAIRYGERPDVRARLHQVIDDKVGEGLGKLIAEQALTSEVMEKAEIEEIHHRMEEAEARKLQPHYIKSFFQAAFESLGGRIRKREPGRPEITNVPAIVRNRDRQIGVGKPIPQKYERITFEKELIRTDALPPAELVAPGHPLLSATIDLLLERNRDVFTRGAVLVDSDDESEVPRVLVMLEHAIADARPSRVANHTVVSRRFEFIEIPEGGEPVAAGYAPYLDYRPASPDEMTIASSLLSESWLSGDLEEIGRDHAIRVAVPQHLADVRAHTERRVDRVRAAVKDRLTREINHWDHRASVLREAAAAGKQPKMNPDRAEHRATELSRRLEVRMRLLDQERALMPLPPIVVGGALVLPHGLLVKLGVGTPAEPTTYTADKDEIERRAVAAVLDAEARLGRDARDMNTEQRNNPGYDIQSVDADGGLWFIEVKGRVAGARTVTVSRNEIITGLNQPDRFVLALVEVEPDGGETVRYLRKPFSGDEEIFFDMESVNYSWTTLWARGRNPS